MSYIGNQPFTAAFLTDTFSGNGSTVAFTMTVAPANTSSIIVAITGVLQDPSTYSVSGTTLTFSAAPPSGTSNISVRYLGIPASGVTTTAYRTVTNFTATAGQTSFSVPSYTVGYIDVYRNGVRLVSTDYTATTGTTVVLANACTSGDSVVTESFLVSSVLNAIPATNASINSSYLASGVARANWGAGGILQVANVTKTDVFTTTSSSFVDVTGLTVNITPASSSSKILVMVSFYFSSSSTTGYPIAQVLRNSTPIYVGDAAGSRTPALVQTGGGLFGADGGTGFSVSAQFVDSPATTSSTTYKIQVLQSGGNTVRVGATGDDSNASNRIRAAASIVLMEIAA